MQQKPCITPGKDASIAILISDYTNPLAAVDAAGLTVTAYLSATKGGPPIDASLAFNAAEQQTTIPGFKGRLYLLAIPGTATKTLLAPFVDDCIFACATVNSEPLAVVEIDVQRAAT